MKFRLSFRPGKRALLTLAASASLVGFWTGSPARADEVPADIPPPASAPTASALPTEPKLGLALSARLANAFDGPRAFADLERQVAFGPRLPGSPATMEFLQWLEGELALSGFETERQYFTAPNPLTGGISDGCNVVATVNPGAPKVILLSCHFDCRGRADQDPNPNNRRLPVDGANDGASGVAVLVEIARVLKANPLPKELGVMLVFFDIEDQGRPRENQTFCLGSLHFAQQFDHAIKVSAAVNLDMVGDADLLFKQEGHSLDRAPEVAHAFWTHGEALFPANFSRERLGYVFDDHVRLQAIGLPAIDVIDFDYPAWHTAWDVPAACSPQSLRATGATALSFLGAGGAPRFP
jgi:glutaminyl-peptide cyclotransferase